MSLGKTESSSSPSSVYGAQDPYLEALYGGAYNSIFGQPTAPTTQNQGTAWGLGPQFSQSQPQPQPTMSTTPIPPSGSAYDYANQVAGSSMDAYNTQLQGGYIDPSLAYLDPIASGQAQNEHLAGAIDAGLYDINQNYSNYIMPEINTGSALTNTSGGSRQGIAQGLAAGQANEQATNFVNEMYSQNYATSMDAQLQALGQLGGLNTAANQNSLQALGMSPEMAMMGTAADQAYYQQQMMPYQALGNILGPPVTLGGGSSSSGWDVGMPSE